MVLFYEITVFKSLKNVKFFDKLFPQITYFSVYELYAFTFYVGIGLKIKLPY